MSGDAVDQVLSEMSAAGTTGLAAVRRLMAEHGLSQHDAKARLLAHQDWRAREGARYARLAAAFRRGARDR